MCGDQCAVDSGVRCGANRFAGARRGAFVLDKWLRRRRPVWLVSCIWPVAGVAGGYVRRVRVDGVAVCGVPVRGARGADVSHRGFGAVGR